MSNLKINLKNKILLTFILIPVCAFLIISVIALVNLRNMVGFAIDAGYSLGKNAITNSRHAIIKEFEEELQILAVEQALITEIHLKRIEAETENIARLYFELLSNPAMSRNPMMRKSYNGTVPDEFSLLSVAPDADTAKISREIEYLAMMYNPIKFVYLCNSSADAVGIVTEGGAYLKYTWFPNPQNFDPRKREWYRKAVNNPGKTVWHGPYTSVSTNEDVITCSKAVLMNGAPVAVVMSDIAPKTFADDLVAGAENSCDVFIVDQAGNIIAREGVIDKNTIWNCEDKAEEKDGMNLLKAMTSGQKGGRRLTRDGKVYYIGFAPIAANGWSVGVIIAEKTIIASSLATQASIESQTRRYNAYIDDYINRTRLIYSGIGLLILIIVTVVSICISRRLRNSVAVLEACAIKIGNGQLDVKIDLKSQDEFQELAEAFNTMTGNLKEHIRNIEANLSKKQQMEQELAAAAQIQQSMLPRKFPAFPHRNELDIYATTIPAREVGGDFYDYFFIDDNHLYFCIGDVSGKGIPAAMFMAKAVTLLRYEALAGVSPGLMLANVGNALAENNSSCMFASVICAILDVSTGEMIYANAGHNPPLLYDGKTFEYMKLEGALVIGCFKQNAAVFKPQRLTLNKGDILFMYTDGVNEAMDIDNQEYGNERLYADLQAMAGANPKEIYDHIKSKLAVHCNGADQSDDITMLALKFQG
ncbi:MAG: SpoIIE family protein phosphatase [Victivallaceae bacterium]